MIVECRPIGERICQRDTKMKFGPLFCAIVSLLNQNCDRLVSICFEQLVLRRCRFDNLLFDGGLDPMARLGHYNIFRLAPPN